MSLVQTDGTIKFRYDRKTTIIAQTMIHVGLRSFSMT